VCNGVELSSGAIRNHKPEIMKKAFEIAGYGEDVLIEKFGGLYRAFQYGAPPHGGIAPGLDRIVMLLCGEQNLREVVLFPMNQQAEDPLLGAPSEARPQAAARTAHPPRPAAKAALSATKVSTSMSSASAISDSSRPVSESSSKRILARLNDPVSERKQRVGSASATRRRRTGPAGCRRRRGR
jgi:hypothetical protein